MNILCNRKDRSLIVKISGEIDHHTTEYIREKIEKELKASNMKNIIFDLSQVTFMDSSGIGMVIGRYKEISSLGGKVLVASVSESADIIFKISGLYKIIPKCDNITEAINCI